VSSEIKKMRKREGLPEFVEAPRKCLSCEIVFTSKWIGNRICDACKAEQAQSDIYDFDPGSHFAYDEAISQLIYSSDYDYAEEDEAPEPEDFGQYSEEFAALGLDTEI